MARLQATPLVASLSDGAEVSRPNLYRLTSPYRLTDPARPLLRDFGLVQPGTVREDGDMLAFAVSPGECFVRLSTRPELPTPSEGTLVTSCCDSHVEWRFSGESIAPVLTSYASHGTANLVAGRAIALAIAGERMILVLTQTDEALLYHDVALLDWFAGLLRAVRG